MTKIKVEIDQSNKISKKAQLKQFILFNLKNFVKNLRINKNFSALAQSFAFKDEQTAKNFFNKYVKFVEVEVFSFCNRKCWFCPNSYIDRKSENNYMDEKVYLKVLNELAEFNYNGKISYSRYNEPFADDIIFTRVAQARKIVPNSFLTTYTNGDYISKAKIEQAIDAGFNEINMMVYFPKGMSYNNDYIQKRLNMMSKKLDLEYTLHVVNANSFEAKFKIEGIDLYLKAFNFEEIGTNRADSLNNDKIKPYDRVEPCYMPFTNMYIDYNGNYVPCCNIRSDVQDHKKFVLGNAKDKSIFEIYAGKKLSVWRKSLIGYGKKTSPCATCNVALNFEQYVKQIEGYSNGNK